MIGEAASQSDPITGNGVTAALRHADEGSAMILKYRQQGTVPTLARYIYNMRVSGLGRYFNSLIEKLYYEAAVRSVMGLFLITQLYTVPAWSTNVIYTRTRPRGLFGTLALCSAMYTLRGAAWGLSRISSALLSRSKHNAKRAAPGRVIEMDVRGEASRALHLSR